MDPAREEFLIMQALKRNMVNQAQVDDARKVRKKLTKMGIDKNLIEVLSEKGYISAVQAGVILSTESAEAGGGVCAMHPDRHAVGVCAKCGRKFCISCRIEGGEAGVFCSPVCLGTHVELMKRQTIAKYLSFPPEGIPDQVMGIIKGVLALVALVFVIKVGWPFVKNLINKPEKPKEVVEEVEDDPAEIPFAIAKRFYKDHPRQYGEAIKRFEAVISRFKGAHGADQAEEMIMTIEEEILEVVGPKFKKAAGLEREEVYEDARRVLESVIKEFAGTTWAKEAGEKIDAMNRKEAAYAYEAAQDAAMGAAGNLRFGRGITAFEKFLEAYSEFDPMLADRARDAVVSLEEEAQREYTRVLDRFEELSSSGSFEEAAAELASTSLFGIKRIDEAVQSKRARVFASGYTSWLNKARIATSKKDIQGAIQSYRKALVYTDEERRIVEVNKTIEEIKSDAHQRLTNAITQAVNYVNNSASAPNLLNRAAEAIAEARKDPTLSEGLPLLEKINDDITAIVGGATDFSERIEKWQNELADLTILFGDRQAIPQDEQCSRCRGSGTTGCTKCLSQGVALITCTGCDGKGRRECKECKGVGKGNCWKCKGTGQMRVRRATSKSVCRKCRGSGVLCDCRSGFRYTYQVFTVSCKQCGGQRLIECKECEAEGSIACVKCKESGEANGPCPRCDGRAYEFCMTCKGGGRKGW